MNAFGSDVLILMQLLVACAVVLCGAEALFTDFQSKILIRIRNIGQRPRR